MTNSITLVVIGLVLIIAGLAVIRGGRKSRVHVGNTGISVFGSVTQIFQSIGMVLSIGRAKSPRDLVGWSISILGLIVGLIGLTRL